MRQHASWLDATVRDAEDDTDLLVSTDDVLRWEIRGNRHAAFATDFDYRSG